MKKMKFWISGALLALALAAHGADITVKGSDTLVILAQKWAETYMQSHPEVKIQVTGGGSGVGLAALQNGQTDIADASRPINAKEQEACVLKFGAVPTEYKVAVDGLSVYVNKDNPVKSLDMAQLQGIFIGKITNWKEVGGKDAPINIYSRENSSGTYEFFKEHVLKKKDFAASAQTMPGTAILVGRVESDPNGIGYGGAAYTTGARAIGVKKTADATAVEPTEDTVRNGSYPIWRYLYNYVLPKSDTKEIAAYLKWIRSAEGQKLAKDVGYYPLPADLQTK
ncbi:MAG TPA: phosphate ABC transporter substrate-binding protein [Verrucomicrobiae bacterium]|jgi:phosphate transport system substrate-binding protein|nr:phosphate ABC transporter substrate-binding protein [Verrucomicrobiae bacterium]